LISLLGFFLLPISVIGAVALIVGILALFDIRKYCFRGIRMAVAGIAMSLIGVLIPPACVYYSIRHESLPGHARINFRELIRSGPPEFDRYVGKPIRLNGFALPERERELTRFKFSPDTPAGFQEPKHWIMVEFPDQWSWQESKIVVSGTLMKIDNPLHEQPEYILKAKTVRPVANRLTLVTFSRRGGGC
jgi:hypothetical protein